MGNGPWGLPPSWAPPQPSPPPWAPGASVMWNMTARAWGFWNNKIWTLALMASYRVWRLHHVDQSATTAISLPRR